MVPDSLVLNAASILRRLQAGKAPHVELVGEVEVGGRRAYRLRITSMKLAPGFEALYRELYVDAETYAPLMTSWHEKGVNRRGRSFSYLSRERIVERRVLPDTAENRKLLRVRGPTR
jgi:hypothetical protein